MNSSQRSIIKKHSNAGLHIKLVFIAILTLAGWNHANAGETTINCPDLNNSKQCQISGDGGFSQSLANFAADIIKANNNNVSVDSLCEKDKNGFAYECRFSKSESAPKVGCKKGESDNSLVCNLVGTEPEILSIDCKENADNSGGTCSLKTDEEAAAKELKKVEGLPVSQINFGSTLIAACASRTATQALQNDCDTMLSALSGGTAADKEKIAATLKAVIPTNFDHAIDFGKQAVYAQIKTLNNRLKDLRSNKSSGNTANLQFFDGRQWLKTGDLVASSGSTMNDAAPENALLANSRLGFFINGTLMDSEQESTDNEGATETTSQMLTLGIDYRFTNNVIGGFAFNYDTSDTDYANNKGDISTSGMNMMAYASYFIDAWYLDATIMRGGTDYDQTRKLSCDASCVTAFEQTATAKYYGNTTGFTVSTGYDFNFNALSVTPFAQLNSTKITLDAYKETMSNPGGAGSGYGLDMKEQSRSMMTFSLGSQLRYVWAQSWGVIVPHLDLEFVKELDDDENVITGNFIGNVATTKDFKLTTNKIDTGYFFVGFGASAQLQNGSSGFINIRTLQGYQYLDQTIYSLGWRWEI